MIRRDFEGGLLLISQPVHAWVAGQLARRWGNHHFTRPEPWEELILVAAQHDNGWAEWELMPRIDGDGRPVSFMEMDLEEHFAIWQRSAERMQAANYYGALLISMHAVALYEGRLADDARGDTPEMRARIQGFIEDQRAFQKSIRQLLVDHPRYGPALEQARLAEALRLLQVWDLLSLLLLMGPVPRRTVAQVPDGTGKRVTIQLEPEGGGKALFDPYPFEEAPFVVRANGRWLAQRTFGHNALFRRALAEAQLVEVEVVIDRAD